MTYTERELQDALKAVRNRFFRSVGIAAIVGMAGLYLLLQIEGAEKITTSALLFCGFIVGFFIAGVILPEGFKAQLRKTKS